MLNLKLKNLTNYGKIFTAIVLVAVVLSGFCNFFLDVSDDDFPNRMTIHSPGMGTESLARFVWKRVMLADELSDRFFEIRRRSRSTPGG